MYGSFLAYVQRFDIVQQAASTSAPHRGPPREPTTQQYVLKRSTRADTTRMGDVIPLSHLRAPADLIPRFYRSADIRMTKENCLEYSTEFFLNKFFNKDMYYSLDDS